MSRRCDSRRARRRLEPALALMMAAWLCGLGVLAEQRAETVTAEGSVVPDAAVEEPEAAYELVRSLASPQRQERRRAAAALRRSQDRSMVAPLVDMLFFIPRERRAEAVRALEALTGADLGESYYVWVEYLGARPELTPPADYLEWKASLLARIDPRFRQILYSGAPYRIRMEEVVWGGVRVEEIPALDRPAVIPAAEAAYLEPDERVFGVALAGQARAYPLRILSWHEMLNDELGGHPVTLSFCTLCGSGILYSGRVAGAVHTFGTSGLLFRSNKLMVDRQTLTLWSNLTGEAVVGRLAESPLSLEMLPSTLTTWEAWRQRHPQTTVLDLRPLERRYPFGYRPGAADQAREGVSFPVWARDDRLPRDAEVFAVRLGPAAKAWPLEQLMAAGVVNDVIGQTGLVLVVEPGSSAVRAYRRGELRFRRHADGILRDAEGRAWLVTEAALVPSETRAEEASAPLERLPGHVAIWFGWYGFFPHTELSMGD